MMDNDHVPPSSPPHPSNIPSSPFLGPQYNATSPKSSSPPPLFSSDDSRESVDITNYQSPRIHKNKRAGTWWHNGESAPNTTEPKKTKMSRNFDSGVYMMSDATDSSESLLPLHKSPFGLDITDDAPQADEDAELLVPQKLSDDDYVFNSILHLGLEKNSQNYDFSNLDLRDNDIRQIGQLTSVIRNVPDSGGDLPAEGQYRSMTPDIYVSLRNNQLCHLTPSLFSVHNLTNLVLEDNRIQELPAEISLLRNLKYLTISRNNIRWLPFDMLQLFRPLGALEIIGDSGVPWLQPKIRQKFKEITLEGRLRDMYHAICESADKDDFKATVSQHMQTVYEDIKSHPARQHLVWILRDLQLRNEVFGEAQPELDSLDCDLVSRDWIYGTDLILLKMATTPVTYFDHAGAVVKGSALPAISNKDEYSVITQTEFGAHGIPLEWFRPTHFKSLNSLITASVHSALRHKDQENLTIPELRDRIGEPMPPEADAILLQAEHNSRCGYSEFRQCHVCKKDYVVARAEWIQWWRPGHAETYPFKVKVCSWGCIPQNMRERPTLELRWD